MSNATHSFRNQTARVLLLPAKAALLAALLQGTAARAEHTLGNGAQMAAGQSLTSASGEYRMTVEKDGRVVVYRIQQPASGTGSTPATVTTHWDSGSASPVHGTLSLEMQKDNNLVLYDTVGGTERRAVWDSRTSSEGRAETGTLVLQDNGELTVQSGGECIWNSMRSITSLGGGRSKVSLSLPK